MTTQVTASMVKELRDRTGVGMSKCKQALQESNGSIDEAISFLRKSGMASAVKKEGRETKEGTIVGTKTAETVAVVEVNAETDFVAKNELFVNFVDEVLQDAVQTKPANVEAFLKQTRSADSSMTIDEYRASVIQTIGENIKINRLLTFPNAANSSTAIYSHMGGKILSVVVVEGSDDEEALAKDIAMHVAAEAPEYLSPDDISAETKASEEDVARAQVQGKPEHIIGKIIEGKLNAFFNQTCLLRQKYIKDSDLTIEELVQKRAKESGKALNVTRFVRWRVGSL